LALVIRACTDAKLPISTEGQMPQYECSTRALIVPRAVSGMWSSARWTRAAAAKGVVRLATLTPASLSFGL
jgi:hypothetical protein